ncbi:MAG: nucleotidyltransferase domain-containing protein [Bacteroidales bacterium]|nr:nucleotidyltransferase domain-containing protein [Bacteroidales bacterium]
METKRQGKKRSTAVVKKIIAEYFKTQPVIKAWLFGSFARGEQNAQSDVDILFEPDYSGKPFTLFTMGGMYMDLRRLLGRDIDLVAEGSLHKSVVQSVEREKILVYEREGKR